MSKMMRNSGALGCHCCNDWDGLSGRQRDKRESEREIREELATFRPVWIDPRWYDRYGQ